MKNIKLREANINDSEMLLHWRNDPAARQASFNSKLVGEKEHQKWFRAVLRDPKRKIYVAENAAGEKIGMIRMDIANGGNVEISINLAPEMRGKGYGKAIISEACRQRKGSRFFVARAKEMNHASVKVFEKAGFVKLFDYLDERRRKIIVLLWSKK